jgi:hypothetical protein
MASAGTGGGRSTRQREVAFEEYKRTFAKTYESDEDHNNRHLVFHWNLRFIHSFNRQVRRHGLERMTTIPPT